MNKILILGNPASGKTTLAKRLAHKHAIPVIHTDSYIGYGHRDNLYVLLKDLEKRQNEKLIIEGVLAYRLLRKGIEGTGYNWQPDLVLEVEAPIGWIEGVYANERSDKDFRGVERMIKANNTVLEKYEALLSQRNIMKPEWIKVENRGLKFAQTVNFLNL